MASEAPKPQLPMLYGDLAPLSSEMHANFKLKRTEKAPYLSEVHAVPVTIDEFMQVQRFMPIIFSAGDQPVPLALMGLNEGANVFIEEDGSLAQQQIYLPAYIRRYPFLLARIQQDSDELSLCFDPSSDLVGDFDDGDALFDGTEPSETTKEVLKFCEGVEQSGQRTVAFMQELQNADLLMDGEAAIQVNEEDKPFIYRGFKMVNEEKLREIDAETAQKFVKNGILPLVYAHLNSMATMREIFGRQLQQGKLPPQADAQIPENVN